jgi:hypothetical protein
MNIREATIPVGKTRSGKPLKSFAGVTIHNTGNHDAGADANANARYLYNNAATNIAGFHYVVDEKEAVCTIPENEIAEHSGRRAGNDTTVSIEICDNQDGNILIATEIAAQLAAEILLRHGQTKAIWKENLFQHNDWSGKNCPEDIRAGKPYDWDTFISRVNAWMSEEAPPAREAAPAEGLQVGRLLSYKCTVKSTLNFRPGPSTSGKPLGVFRAGEVLTVMFVCGDWVQVYAQGKVGYVAKDYVTFNKPLGGDDVRALQEALKASGSNPGTVDGIFGQKTAAAVTDTQEKKGLSVDGVAGKQTTTALGGTWTGK